MKNIFDELKANNAAYIGGVIGFVLALFLILFGFFKTLFVIVLTTAGFFIGRKYFINKEDLKELLDKILPPGRFR